jgi:hypothetical protein
VNKRHRDSRSRDFSIMQVFEIQPIRFALSDAILELKESASTPELKQMYDDFDLSVYTTLIRLTAWFKTYPKAHPDLTTFELISLLQTVVADADVELYLPQMNELLLKFKEDCYRKAPDQMALQLGEYAHTFQTLYRQLNQRQSQLQRYYLNGVMTNGIDLDKEQIDTVSDNDSGIGGMDVEKDEDRESVWPDDETCLQERMAMDDGSRKRVAEDDVHANPVKRVKKSPSDETGVKERMVTRSMVRDNRKRVAQDDEHMAHAKRVKNNPAEKPTPHAVKQRVSYHKQPNRQSLTKFSSNEQLRLAMTGVFQPDGYRTLATRPEVCCMVY